MDWLERALVEISEKLAAAWAGNRCTTCPIGELSALAAAALQLYREQQQRSPKEEHWSRQWQRDRET